MTDDSSQILDDILCRWHQWRPGNMAKGYNSRALVVGEYRISRQYDYDNGAWDDDIEDARMKVVDFQVCEMKDPYRAAIYVNAKALVYGIAVFRSPRLPVDKQECDAVISAARAMLVGRLLSAGVM